MNVLLTGASGFVGRNLAMALWSAGHAVRPVSRRDGHDMQRMQSPADWLSHLAGIDAVVNAAGIIGETGRQRFDAVHTEAPVALFQACVRAGVRRVVQVSALGADGTAFSRFHRSKRAADDALLDMPLDGFVIRPSLIYGCGGASAAFLLRLAALPLVPVLGAGRQMLQPVHISDVIATILQALRAPPSRRAIDVVGPESVCYADWMQRLRAAQGLSPGRLLHVPYTLALAMSGALRWLQPLAAPDNLRMLRCGYRGDKLAAEQFLGRSLLAPAPELQFDDASILWRTA